MGGQGRKTIIPHVSPKRYRRCKEPDFPTEERLSFVQSLSLLRSQLPQRGSHWHVGQASLRTTSQSASQTAPLVGEPLAKPFTLRGLPKPPLGRGGGSASALTERLSPAVAHGQALLRPTSQSASLDKAGLRLPASASLPLASCWPRPQQLLPVSATGGGRRRCP